MTPASAPPKFRITDEQAAILEHAPTSHLIVPAFAGTGKTSTLVAYANKWRRYRGLYLAFNADIRKEARRRFPPNVTVETMHSFAYKALRIGDLHARPQGGNIRQKQLRALSEAALGDPHYGKLSSSVLGTISAAFRRFLISDGSRFRADFLPRRKHLGWSPEEVEQAALRMTKHLMAFKSNAGPFTHDMYLKAFALMQEKYRPEVPYDFVMVDEAQDLNPVMIGIVRRFGVPLIIVGDQYQSIYAFRGAVSAMGEFEGPRLPLTRSWRFGPALARAANMVLSHVSSPPRQVVSGGARQPTRILEGTADGGMFLARTNARLFELLVSNQSKTFHIAGGYDSLRREIEAAIDLWLGRPPRGESPLPYQDAAEKISEADHGDPVAARIVGLLERYNTSELAHHLQRLEKLARRQPAKAELHLSTAHRSKGLEDAPVTLLDDFWSLQERLSFRTYLERIGQWGPSSEREFDQELHLLYVALTRAKEQVFLPRGLFGELCS